MDLIRRSVFAERTSRVATVPQRAAQYHQTHWGTTRLPPGRKSTFTTNSARRETGS